jgi:hypothetical protein
MIGRDPMLLKLQGLSICKSFDVNANSFLAFQEIPEPSSEKSVTKPANLIQVAHFNFGLFWRLHFHIVLPSTLRVPKANPFLSLLSKVLCIVAYTVTCVPKVC